MDIFNNDQDIRQVLMQLINGFYSPEDPVSYTHLAYTYNIVGEIPGENPDRMILLSGHYDSYFSGFQDDNTAVSMLIEIGRMLIKSNYKPHNTIVLCAMAAEEWGVINSKYDWSTGAYEEVFTVHPEWKLSLIHICHLPHHMEYLPVLMYLQSGMQAHEAHPVR